MGCQEKNLLYTCHAFQGSLFSYIKSEKSKPDSKDVFEYLHHMNAKSERLKANGFYTKFQPSMPSLDINLSICLL